jgi:thiosulfate reductase cytochrome b subunit
MNRTATLEVQFKHPRAIRWFHWINFPLLSLMIWSGALIYWADDEFIAFPKAFYNALDLHHRLAEGMAFHFWLMWLFALNGIAYGVFLAWSGEWRLLLPRPRDLKASLLVALHDLKLRREAPAIEGIYNAAQRIAYTAVLVMGAGSLLTGLAIYKPVQLSWLTGLLGGYRAARLEHFILTLAYLAFFVLHVSQVARAGWNNFRAMVSGYEIRK